MQEVRMQEVAIDAIERRHAEIARIREALAAGDRDNEPLRARHRAALSAADVADGELIDLECRRGELPRRAAGGEAIDLDQEITALERAKILARERAAIHREAAKALEQQLEASPYTRQLVSRLPALEEDLALIAHYRDCAALDAFLAEVHAPVERWLKSREELQRRHQLAHGEPLVVQPPRIVLARALSVWARQLRINGEPLADLVIRAWPYEAGSVAHGLPRCPE